MWVCVCVCVSAQAVPFSKEVSKNNWRPEIGRDTQLSPAVQSQRPWLTWTDRLQFFNCKKANFVCVCVCVYVYKRTFDIPAVACV